MDDDSSCEAEQNGPAECATTAIGVSGPNNAVLVSVPVLDVRDNHLQNRSQ